MKPMTLTERVDRTIEEFSKDPVFFSSVLDGMREKTAGEETPAEVSRMIIEIQKETGMDKDAAVKVAWETYLRYINPGFAKAGGKIPPQFLKKDEAKAKKEEPKKPGHKSAAAELAEKLGVAAEKASVPAAAKTAAVPAKPDHAPKFKTASARSLAESLGV